MVKKALAALLIFLLLFGMLTACTKGKDEPVDSTPTVAPTDNAEKESDSEPSQEPTEPVSKLEPMTTDEITLTYACWGLHEKGEIEVRDMQLAAFMEAYPNIKVEFIEIAQSAWNEALYNRAAAGTLPDVFWVFSVIDAVANQWALEVTDMFDADPDTQEIYPGIREISQYDGRRFHVPCIMFPNMVFINKTLFDMYNVPLPDYDWTFEDFKELAVLLSHPEDYNFGTSNPVYWDFFDAWYNGTSSYGWDGKDWHIGKNFADAYNLRLDWIDQKVVEWMTSEEKEQVLGDPAAWPPGKGRSAMHIDFPWTMATFNDVVSVETGCEFLYYPMPQGPTGRQQVIVDNSVISATTKYPREAWELQKWTSWGVEACKNRFAGYQEAGAPLSRMPVITNNDVWDQIISNAPNEPLKAFYEHLTDVVPAPYPFGPGWSEFMNWMGEQDIWGRIDRREIKPEDVVDEMNAKINEFKENFLASIDY